MDLQETVSGTLSPHNAPKMAHRSTPTLMWALYNGIRRGIYSIPGIRSLSRLKRDIHTSFRAMLWEGERQKWEQKQTPKTLQLIFLNKHDTGWPGSGKNSSLQTVLSCTRSMSERKGIFVDVLGSCRLLCDWHGHVFTIQQQMQGRWQSGLVPLQTTSQEAASRP